MRWLFCLAVLALALGSGMASAQNSRVPNHSPAPPIVPPMERTIPPPMPQPEPPMPHAELTGSQAPRTVCVPHWTIAMRECSALEQALQGVAWDSVQGRLDRWAEGPGNSPDPQCVRYSRDWQSC